MRNLMAVSMLSLLGCGSFAASDAGVSCPVSAPTVDSRCGPVGLKCEYGANPQPSCNVSFECTASGWVGQMSSEPCPAPTLCPASYASIKAGQDCTTESLGCDDAQGQCLCTTRWGGPQRVNPAWACVDATATCPTPRPRIGERCTRPDASCNYGACSGGVDVKCVSGRWQEQVVPCPL